MKPSLPGCCTPAQAIWPFAQALAGVHLWHCHFDPSAMAAQAFTQAAIEPPANILRAVSKRQAEFLAGRLCARAALIQLDSHAQAPALGEDRAPIWPAGICGSITHSNGWAAAIVAEQQHWRGLGLDCETLLSNERASRLAEEILTPTELQRLAELPEAERAQQVTLTFSAKESLFKALYPIVQKRFYFHDAELLSGDSNGQLQLRLLIDLREEWRAGTILNGQYARLEHRILSLLMVATLA